MDCRWKCVGRGSSGSSDSPPKGCGYEWVDSSGPHVVCPRCGCLYVICLSLSKKSIPMTENGIAWATAVTENSVGNQEYNR
jgi:hypothetical protein